MRDSSEIALAVVLRRNSPYKNGTTHVVMSLLALQVAAAVFVAIFGRK